MRSVLVSQLILSILLFSCEEEALRSQTSRPLEEGDEMPGFLEEENRTLTPNQDVTINISKTSLFVPKDATAEKSIVRIRTLESPPIRSETTDLGEALGDVIHVTFLKPTDKSVFGSELFNDPYELRQLIEDSSTDNINYVVITDPGSDEEEISLISKNAISKDELSIGLTTTAFTLDLKLTNAVVYAIAATDKAQNIKIVTNSDELTSTGGGDQNSGSSTSTARGTSENDEIICPTNFALVPAAVVNSRSIANFCVMKYEAKSANFGKIDTSPAGNLWTAIDQSKPGGPDGIGAIEACEAMGSGYQLISNDQWQSIAQNIETAKSIDGDYLNWSNQGGDSKSIEAFEFINRGHVSASPYDPIDSKVGDPCYKLGGSAAAGCTDNTKTEFNSKRTHTLSNGEVIWDFSGNLSEWIRETTNFSYGLSGKWSLVANDGNTCESPQCDGPPGTAIQAFGPKNIYSQAPEPYYRGLGEVALSASGGSSGLIRGGFFDSGANGGIFAIKAVEPTEDSNVGFPCTYVP